MTIHHHAHQAEIAKNISQTFIKEVIQFSSQKVRSPKLIAEVLRA